MQRSSSFLPVRESRCLMQVCWGIISCSSLFPHRGETRKPSFAYEAPPFPTVRYSANRKTTLPQQRHARHSYFVCATHQDWKDDRRVFHRLFPFSPSLSRSPFQTLLECFVCRTVVVRRAGGKRREVYLLCIKFLPAFLTDFLVLPFLARERHITYPLCRHGQILHAVAISVARKCSLTSRPEKSP